MKSEKMGSKERRGKMREKERKKEREKEKKKKPWVERNVRDDEI